MVRQPAPGRPLVALGLKPSFPSLPGLRAIIGSVDFSEALALAKAGKRVRRALWREHGGQVGGWLELVSPVLPNGRMMQPHLACPLPDGQVAAFSGTSWDLLADDWEIMEP